MKAALDTFPLEQTIFYALDKAIKSYRQFAHYNIRKNQIDITIDQWLVLKTIEDHPEMTQKEMARRVFKDYASVTRIIELLVKRNYLTRQFNNEDRRRYRLELTDLGRQTYHALIPIVQHNRKNALQGVSQSEISSLKNTLEKIISNCSDRSE